MYTVGEGDRGGPPVLKVGAAFDFPNKISLPAQWWREGEVNVCLRLHTPGRSKPHAPSSALSHSLPSARVLSGYYGDGFRERRREPGKAGELLLTATRLPQTGQSNLGRPEDNWLLPTLPHTAPHHITAPHKHVHTK